MVDIVIFDSVTFAEKPQLKIVILKTIMPSLHLGSLKIKRQNDGTEWVQLICSQEL